jgi:hypothetical protein
MITKIESPVITVAGLPAVIEPTDRRKFLGGSLAAVGAVAAGAVALSSSSSKIGVVAEHTHAVEVLDVLGEEQYTDLTARIHQRAIDRAIDKPDAAPVEDPLFVTRRAFHMLARNNMIDYIPSRAGSFTMPTYMGRAVIVPGTRLATLMGY